VSGPSLHLSAGSSGPEASGLVRQVGMFSHPHGPLASVGLSAAPTSFVQLIPK